MSFTVEHEKWIQRHLAQRRGERKDALRRGHGYGNRLFAEKIWWILMGHFIGLHPEYEVMDWRGPDEISHGSEQESLFAVARVSLFRDFIG